MKNPHLEHLDISYNFLTREGLRRMRELIKYNSSLRVIDLRGNSDLIINAEICERASRFNE